MKSQMEDSWCKEMDKNEVFKYMYKTLGAEMTDMKLQIQDS